MDRIRGGKNLWAERVIAIDRLSAFERQRLLRINQFEDKDKFSLYDAFDVFALPSTGESFGLFYLEAWMCQKSVIGARMGTTQCAIEDGVDGLLVDPTDPKDIASKIVELLSDRDNRENMGMRGYSKPLRTVRGTRWLTRGKRCIETSMLLRTRPMRGLRSMGTHR